ncbi:MAG: hypothetical protein IJR85_11225 [Synergistaceae bacterium]|nr:hypothetical protein [Synergistaceae bacterium]
MSFSAWDEFWWNNITGPRTAVTRIAEAVLEGRSVVLSIPENLAWKASMRGAVHNFSRDRLNNDDIVIETVDAAYDIPDSAEPGRFILSRFASGPVSRGYREKSRVSVQDYIRAKNVIRNRVVWVKGLNSKNADLWLKFCRGFANKSLKDGVFVLEIEGELRENDCRPLTLVDFGDFISSYDVQLFSSLVLDEQDKYPDTWKKYIAALAASVCGINAETADELIETVDFTARSAAEAIRDISGLPYSELEHMVWSAQVQVLFPLIEMERVSIVAKWREIIQQALDENYVAQYGERITDACDAELGTLCSMMKWRTEEGLYVLYIPDEKERLRISFLHNCRNKIAHASCCSTYDIAILLGGDGIVR